MEQESLDETINWLDGYLDAIIDNDYVKKKQIEKMIIRIANDLNIRDPFAPEESEEFDDLPF